MHATNGDLANISSLQITPSFSAYRYV